MAHTERYLERGVYKISFPCHLKVILSASDGVAGAVKVAAHGGGGRGWIRKLLSVLFIWECLQEE